jgi:hypothetical protein
MRNPLVLPGRLLDRWSVRRWVLWPACALRDHPDTFWLGSRWFFQGDPVPVIITVARCSCGRRSRRAETLS